MLLMAPRGVGVATEEVTMLSALLVDGTYAITVLADKVGDPVASSISTVQVVSILIGTFIPILVALVTKSTATPRVKALVNLALSAASGFGAEFINSANFVWQQALLTTVVTFAVSVATYYGLWKPTNVAGSGSAAGRAITG